MIEAVALDPRRAEDLMGIKGFPRGLARDEGKNLLGRLRAIRDMPDDKLIPYPKGVGRGPSRPPPELEELVDKLKAARNAAAEEVGLPRGTVLSNAVLMSIARAAPKTRDELLQIDGVRNWKADVAGERLLAITTRI